MQTGKRGVSKGGRPAELASDISMQNGAGGTDGPIDAHIQQLVLNTLDAVLGALPSADAGYGEAAEKVYTLAVALEREAHEFADSRLC